MAVLGAKAVFKLDNSVPTLTDRSADTTTSDFTEQVKELDTTTYGAVADSHAVGLYSGSFTVNMIYSTTVDTHLNGVFGQAALLNFEFDPNGTATGNPKYTGLCSISSLKIGAPVNGLNTVNVTLKTSGAITRALN